MQNIIFHNTENQIDSTTKLLCKKYNIQKYSINPDGSIDVDGDVILSFHKLHELPLKFANVGGDFYCSHNKLTTLVGSPISVGGDFVCAINDLTSLVGAPNIIGGSLICSYNKLTSTYSGNIDIELGGSDDFGYNRLSHYFYYNNYANNKDVIKLILKYQRHFEIWNDDLTLIEENFQILLDEINDGLL